MQGGNVGDIMLNDKLVNTLKDYFTAQLQKHRMNATIMLNNPQGIPEHTDWMESVEKEIEKMAEYDEKLHMVAKYLK